MTSAPSIPGGPCCDVPSVERHSLLVMIGVTWLLLAGCVSAPQPTGDVAGHQPGEEGAVLAVMDSYLRALSANDLASMAKLQTPDGMTYVAGPSSGQGLAVVGRPSAFWVEPARRSDGVVRERYWSPTVLVRGSIAVVWAPYEFWADGKTSHCGVDAFGFVKVDERWLIANAMWTVEPDACERLRPRNPAELRPRE